MTYRVVFDIVERGYDPTPALFGLPFLFVGALQWFSARRGIPEAVRLNATVPARWSPGPLFSIALVAVGLLLTATYWDYVHDCAALAAGQARVVEGPVVHLDYGAGRSPHRRFEVAGVPFHFKPSMLESSSRESGLRETLLRDGLAVRIHALDGEIVRLEVASEAASISRPEGPRAAPSFPVRGARDVPWVPGRELTDFRLALRRTAICSPDAPGRGGLFRSGRQPPPRTLDIPASRQRLRGS